MDITNPSTTDTDDDRTTPPRRLVFNRIAGEYRCAECNRVIAREGEGAQPPFEVYHRCR